MKLKQYQESSIQKLVNFVIEQLDIDGMRRKIVFQAPTGAGKTVMMSEAMCRLHETIADSDCQYNRVAFIWIAPNTLHRQSYLSMKNAFTETKRLTPVIYEELDQTVDGYIKPGEVFFVNWDSINKEKNVMVRGSEQTSSVYDIIRRTTQDHNIPVVCIIDEEQMSAGKDATKSEKVLSQINPKVEVRISATPKTKNYDAFVKIDRSQVINEGMIKMGISLNPAVGRVQSDESLNVILLEEALKKRDKLAAAYKKLGVDINPLLLIQLPNDNSATLSQDEVQIKDQLLMALEVSHGRSGDNGKVAIWLSGKENQKNLEGIEKQNSMVDVLLFKQAIATGWDCPRAAVLLIFRKLNSESFTIQTVGRIMRMPQQKFYSDPMLNMGYVYTDLSADVIRVEPDDIGYINMMQAKRKENLNNITLCSFKEERSNKENNVLRSDFKKVMLEYFAKEWTQTYRLKIFSWDEVEEPQIEDNKDELPKDILENRRRAESFINFNIKSIKVEIPTDMEIQDEEGIIQTENKTGFARTPFEVKQVFDKFCSSQLNGWSKSQSMSIFQTALLSTMETLFYLFETDARKIICSKQNQPKFADVIGKALMHYKNHVMPERKLKSQRGLVGFYWTVPEERIYKDSTYSEKPNIKGHALLPFFELNNVSTPERNFTDFLEANLDSIDWWYKNGDSGSEHFAVKYTNSQGKECLFYVDYIIRMKNGRICLFDTKSSNSDPEAPYKHNGLVDYMADDEQKDLQLLGGVIIEDNQNWKYSSMKIDDTSDLTGWNSFYPNQI